MEPWQEVAAIVGFMIMITFWILLYVTRKKKPVTLPTQYERYNPPTEPAKYEPVKEKKIEGGNYDKERYNSDGKKIV